MKFFVIVVAIAVPAVVTIAGYPDRPIRLLIALAAGGADPAGGTVEQFAALIRADVAKWTKVIQAAGIRAD